MAVLVTLAPQDSERQLVEERLGPAVAASGLAPLRWLVDEVDATTGRPVWTGAPDGVRGLLSLWPRGELRRAGTSLVGFPDLEWLKVATAGANHVPWNDVPAGVQVMTSPGALSDLMAEYVLGGVIGWARDLHGATRRIRRGEFPLGEPARALCELRIGTVGHGSVGQAVAREMAARGAAVRAVSRSGRRAANAPVERVDAVGALPDLAEWADVLVVCVPLRSDTVGLIDRDVLERLGEGLLVNVARGPVVDEDALYTWLSGSHRRGAVLDVWWKYPRDGGFPFTRPFHLLDNVVMTPHNSGNAAGFRRRMIRRACDDLAEDLGSGRFRHVEDPAKYVGPARQD